MVMQTRSVFQRQETLRIDKGRLHRSRAPWLKCEDKRDTWNPSQTLNPQELRTNNNPLRYRTVWDHSPQLLTHTT